MRPTQILEREHRVIEQVLDCLDRMAERCESEGRLDSQSARDAVDFFRTFADRCHHGKEEDQLFPMMETRGFPVDAGPLSVMRVEHDHGRAFVRGMESAIDGAAAGDAEPCRTWLEHARGFSTLLREHIRKEDHCLFPMADGAFSENDQLELARAFERVEHHDIGAGVHERCLRLANDLADRFGVTKDRVPEGAGALGCTDH